MLPANVLLGYVVALTASGVLMIVLGAAGLRQSAGTRAVEGVAGLAFLGYAGYLLFFFEGGRVGFVFWVLLAPVLALSNIARLRREHRIRQEQLAATYAAQGADRER
jgi:drug/metabolite transporter (DMT)-like permease